MKKALLTLLALGLFATIAAVAGITGNLAGTASLGTVAQKTVLSPVVTDWVANGKKLLNAHSILAARDSFKQAVAADSSNQEAQFLYGVTRILALYEDGQASNTPGLDSVREILELSGVSFSSFGLYNTKTQSSSQKGFAPTTPSTGAVIGFLSSTVLPEITGAMANLDAVTSSSFSSTINPPAVANGYANDISIDYGDVLVLKSMMHLAASNLQLLGVYGLDFSPPQVLNGNLKEMKRFHDLLAGSDKLLKPLNPANLSGAKSDLLSFIDVFNQSVAQIKGRSVVGGHLYAIDMPLNDTKMGATSYKISQVLSALADVKASLAGPTFYTFTDNMVVDLSKFYNAAAPINLRTLLVDCGSGSVLSDPTLGGVLPLGLGRLEQTVLLHAQEIKGGACVGSEIPKISASPNSISNFFYSPSYPGSPGYSQPPVPITISNDGTANLAVGSITVKGDAAGDYRIAPGTCQTLAPSLAPGNSCTLVASYQPAAFSNYSTQPSNGRAYIDIANNDPQTPHFFIPLSANVAGAYPASYQLNVALAGSGAGSVVSAGGGSTPFNSPGMPSGLISCPGTYMTILDNWSLQSDPTVNGTVTIWSQSNGPPAATLTGTTSNTSTYSTSNGTNGTITFNADGTLVDTSTSYNSGTGTYVTDTATGTWSVTTDGKVVSIYRGVVHNQTAQSSSSTCSAAIPPFLVQQRLIATPASSSTLTGWAGCDRIDGDDCMVNMVSNRSVTATFAVNGKPLTLGAYPVPGHYPASQDISLLANKAVDIYYTLDGSTPGTSSPRYEGPITLPAGATTTVKYLAMDAAGPSAVQAASYLIDGADTVPPVVTAFAVNQPVGGYFGSNNLTVAKFSATDNVNVKDYCITSSSDASFCQWSKEIPTQYYGMGGTTLYAFARDEAGNVSSPFAYDLTPQVTLSWGQVYHHLKSDGVEYDALDVGINSGANTFTTLAGAGIASLKVTGPNGFQYSFSDADKNALLNGQLGFNKTFAAGVGSQSLLKPGVYTVTLTDLQGHTSHRMSTYVTPTRTLPTVSTATVQFQRKGDNSYRVSWAPVNDSRTYYYRLRVSSADSAKTPVFFGNRGMATYADVPAGIMADGGSYMARVEVTDAGPSSDLITNRSDSAWTPSAAPFITPQPSDYNPSRMVNLTPYLYNRAVTDSTFVSAAGLNFSYNNNLSAFTLVELTGPNGFKYTFDLANDVMNMVNNMSTGATTPQFFHEFATALPPGAYTFHTQANGVDQYAYTTLTAPVAYPALDSSTWQVADLGNGSMRFSWANVDHTGALYYRIAIQDPANAANLYFSQRTNQAYVDIAKTTLASSPSPWRVEVCDSADPTSLRNRRNGGFISPVSIPYDSTRPAIGSFRLRSSTASTGALSTLASVTLSSSASLTEIRVAGPGGYSHDLLSEGVYSLDPNYQNQYALTTPGAPAAGLYSITAKDTTGRTATRYMYQGASHLVPQVDYHSVQAEVESGGTGGVRISWAPVVSDVPLWYQLEVYGQSSMNGTGGGGAISLLASTPAGTPGVAGPGDGRAASVLLPSSYYSSSTPLILVRAMDGSNDSVTNNDSQSVMAKVELGRDYSLLSDADGDGFASNADANDLDPTVNPSVAAANPTQLAIIYNYPSSKSTGNYPSSSINVQFNKDINPSTLSGSFLLYNETLQTAVAGSVRYESSGGMYYGADFTPTAPLDANSAYSVLISTGLKDAGGNALAAPYTWSFATGTAALPATSTFAPVTLAWGSVYHRTNGDGSKVDALDAGLKAAMTTLGAGKVTVTGPAGFSPYAFTDADLSGWVSGQTGLYKEFPANSLPNGVYTFTATDPNGNQSYRVSRNVTVATSLPQVDTTTLKMQRLSGNANSAYRLSWAPVNDARPVYYRVRLDSGAAAGAHGAVYTSTRNMITFFDLPPGTMTDGNQYTVRVEASDAPTPDLTTTRSNTAFVDFKPQASDYNANRVQIATNGGTGIWYRTDASGALSTEVQLTVTAPAAVSAVDLRDSTGAVVYNFNVGSDLSNQSFYKKFIPALAPGSYTIHYLANGIDQFWPTTLTVPVAYPKPDSATMRAEDQGNGYIRFSWANVDHTGPVYYRVFVYDKITGPAFNGPVTTSSLQNITFADINKNSIGDLSTKQWRVEVWDSTHFSTFHNRANGDLIDLMPTPYNSGNPVLNSWRIRTMTNSSGASDSMLLVNASAPQGTLAEIRVTGPSGYSRDLLSQGRWSNVYNAYVLEEAGLPAVGLYTFTARDTSGRSATRYFYQTAPHAVPPVDYRTFKTNLEADGSTRVSWAPVASDVPVWYSLNLYGNGDLNGDGLMDTLPTVYGFVDVTNDGVADQLSIYPLTSVTVPAGTTGSQSGPPLFWVTAQDGGQSLPTLATTSTVNGATTTTWAQTLTANVVHNVSHSLMVKGEANGFNYATLSDADGDGFASNVDANDANPVLYPFSAGNDTEELQVTGQTPMYSAQATNSICATFNKGIDQRTLPGNFVLSNGATGTFSYNGSSRQACLKPSSPLPENSTLVVIVGTGVKDEAGNGLSSPVTWYFTIGGTPVSSASPVGGVYTSPQSVTLTANSPSALIFYTTDGSNPTPGTGTTKTYGGPIPVNGSMTIKYFAGDPSGLSEGINTQVYTITVPAAPTGLQAVAASDRVALSWNPVDGAQFYSVYLTGLSAPAVATGSALRDSITAGWYGLDSYNYASGASTVSGWDTSLITLDPDGVTLRESNDNFWDNNAPAWTTTAPPDFAAHNNQPKYLLTSGGWVLGSDSASNYTAALNSDGSATITNKTDLSQQKLSIGIVDLSGAPLTVLGNLPITPGSPVFPAGSLRYDQSFVQLADSYRVRNDIYIPPTVTTLDALPTAFTTNQLYLGSADSSYSYNLVMSSGNVLGIIQNNNLTGAINTLGSGTWEFRTVNGQRILTLTVPAAIRSAYRLNPDLFFAIVNGAVVSGERSVAGQTNYSHGGSSFNATALDHIMSHFGLGAGIAAKTVAASTGTGAAPNPPLATTASAAFTHTGLAVNTAYSYAVTATGNTGESAMSATASATTSQTPVTTASPAGGIYNAAQSVTLTSSVAGSTIYYTTDGSTPAKGSATTSVYQQVAINLAGTTTLKYLAVNPQGVSEAVNTQSYIISPIPITTATATPPGVTFPQGQTVSVALRSSVANAVIYYTTNGSTPDTSSAVYSAPIVFSVSTTLKYFAMVPGAASREAVKVQSYTILVAPPTPVVTASPLGGLYNANQSVTLNASVPADIYYALNDAPLNVDSARYNGPVAITSSGTLKYFAISKEGATGAIRSQTYSIDTVVPATSASPAGGTYSSTVKVALSTSKAAIVYYTTDGSIPTWPATGSTQSYFGPVPIASSAVLRYFSRDAAGNNEPLQSQNYVINPAALATTATPAGGLYNSPKLVTLTTGVTGAVIYYTTDGSAPSTNSAKYTAPIAINASSTTLQYFASANGSNETAKSQTYLIDSAAPSVTRSSPGDGATAIALDTAISITFSKQVAAASLPAASRLLGLSASGSLSADGTVWTVIPSAPLAYGTNYGYLLDGVKDLYGNSLPLTQVGFKTADRPPAIVISTLSLSISSNAVISGNAVSVNGQLSSSGTSTTGRPVSLSVTGPDGALSTIALSTDGNGAYNTDLPAALIQQPGRYLLQAFTGSVDGNLAPASSAPVTLRVLPVAGYAVMVLGRISSGEGEAEHMKSFMRAKNALLARGFDNGNIKTIIADDSDFNMQNVSDAITNWAQGKLNQQPAPLQIILIDHGSPDTFYMEDKNITAEMLAGWLNTLEQGLTPAALAQERYVVIGSCDSGSYVNDLAAPGRIIITSTDIGEESFRGPVEPDNIRGGEYFIDQFYANLQAGQSIRDAFNKAAADVAAYTRQGGVASSTGDKPLQNPLASVNGDPVGVHEIPAGTEENAPDTFYLGTGGNDAFDPTGMLPVEPKAAVTAIFLNGGTTSYTFSVPGSADMKAWFEVRAPSVKPQQLSPDDQSDGGAQIQLITALPQVQMTFDSASGSFKGTYAGFTESGSYDVAIYLQAQAQQVPSARHLTLYKNRAGNSVPNSFQLQSPADKSRQASTLTFGWDQAGDPDGDVVTYTLVISRNQDLSAPSVVKEGLSDPFAVVSYDDGLLDLAGYYWQVWAIDSYGAVTKSPVWGFNTDNTNGGIAVVTGKVTDPATGVGIAGARVSVGNLNATTVANGGYLLVIPPGSFSLGVTATGYKPALFSGLIAASMAVTNKSVTLDALARNFKITASVNDASKGHLDCPASAVSGNTATCTVQPLVGYRVAGISGTCGSPVSTGSVYTTAALSADCTVTATFEALPAVGKPGDYDQNGTVDISEVRRAIDIFLGLKSIDSSVDQDGSGTVNSWEVQKVINAH